MIGRSVFKVAIFIFVLLAGLIANPAFLRAGLTLDIPTQVKVTVCGNGIIENPPEFCDDGVNNKTYVSGTSNHYCAMDCFGWAPMCGDGIVQSQFGEVCDRNSAACAINGYAGIKACDATCDTWLDCVATEYCGDGIVNGPEVCDGTTRACVTNGYSGTQSCKGDCSGWGSCVTPQLCGDGIVEGNEVCDGNSQTCTINGYSGVQTCNQSCSGWNSCVTSEYCGDGIKNGNEQCDGGSNCNSSCQIISSGGGGGGGGGGSSYVPPVATDVVLQGIAYTQSTVNILQDGKLISVTKPDSNAKFTARISNVTPGVWTFGVWAQDKDGRKSITFSFTTLVHQNITTTINGIFLPPTIETDKTSYAKGETLSVLGQTQPKSTVSVTINSPDPGYTGTTKAAGDGTWVYKFDTTPLDDGSHTTKAKAQASDGTSSGYSQSLAFNIGRTPGAGCPMKSDLNEDGKVNLVDFSMLLYNWGVPKNTAVDINCDGKVNLADFSIMMYYWSG